MSWLSIAKNAVLRQYMPQIVDKLDEFADRIEYADTQVMRQSLAADLRAYAKRLAARYGK